MQTFVGVPQESEKWSLAELIDFETAISEWEGPGEVISRDGKTRVGVLKAWLRGLGIKGPGERWMASLSLTGSLLALGFAMAGAGTAWGTLDHELEGIHVVWFLGVALLLPWVVLLVGLIAWLLRGRGVGTGIGAWIIERLSFRIAGERTREVIERIATSGELAGVLGWRVARLSQMIAASFHGGALVGLAAMVLFKRVGFFWETTTREAMEGFLEQATQVMALPWSWMAPWAVPDVASSERGPAWDGGGESWWPFLLFSLLVWGVLPRLLLACFAGFRERRALARLTFQAPKHRKLWRSLTEVKRGEIPSGPVDGALVIVLGGAEPDHQHLRPFLLRRLRLNPTAWESLGVLDEGREAAARAALDKAPAGVVLLAEGWSLAPRQMEAALLDVGSRAGDRRMVLLVGNPAADGKLRVVTEVEREQWERFVDARKGDQVELVFYQEDEA